MSAVFNAADQAVMGPLSEHNYRFLKTLTQVLYFILIITIIMIFIVVVQGSSDCSCIEWERNMH